MTRRVAVPLVLLAVLVWRFERFLLEGVFPVGDDTLDQFYPLAANLFTQLRQGRLPLWSPEILLGYPIAGSPDVHLFSPFNGWFLLAPPPTAMALRHVSALMVSGLGLYFLGRQLGMASAGGLAAAILWIGGYPGDYTQVQPMAAATIPWLPWAVLFWDRACRGQPLDWSVTGGGALGLAVLGGQMQLVYWATVFLLAYFVVIVLPEAMATPRKRRLVRGAAALSLTCGVAALVGAAGVLPTLDLLDDSIRSSLEGSERIPHERPSYRLSLTSLPLVLFHERAPAGADDDRVEYQDSEYRSVGVLSVALALLACGRGRPLDNRLLALALLFLAIATATVFPPTNWLVKHMPGNLFRFPERVGLFFTLVTVILAGRGFDRALDGTAPRFAFARLGLLALASSLAISARIRSPDGLARSEAGAALAALLLVAACLAVSRSASRLGTRRCLAAGAVVAFLVHSRAMTSADDPRTVRSPFLAPTNGLHTADGEAYPPRPLAALSTQDEYGPTRTLEIDSPWEQNLSLLAGYQSPVGYVSLRPARLERIVYGRRRPNEPRRDVAQTLAPHQGLLNLFNVRFLVVRRESFERYFDEKQRRESLTVADSSTGILVVENQARLPRSYFVSRASFVRDEEAAHRRVIDPTFNPRQEVVLEVEPAGSVVETESLWKPARITSYENDRVVVEVSAPRPGWLILLDRAAEGWSAEVNGRATPIRLANYLFRAVPVPLGSSQVVFRYSSRLWRGVAFSAVGILLVALVAGARFARGRRNDRRTAS